MKPVLGNAATSAPNEASFQPMRELRLAQTTSATDARAQSSQTDAAAASSSCATGVLGAEPVQHARQREIQHEGIEAGNRIERQHALAGGEVAGQHQGEEREGDQQDVKHGRIVLATRRPAPGAGRRAPV